MRVMRAHRRQQRGQALIVLALVGLAVFGAGAIALDQGMSMADRRDLQADADAASLAGARSGLTTNAGNYVALQYLAKSLSFTITGLSGPSCTGSSVCPAGTYTAGSYTITLTDNGTTSLDVSISHRRHTLVAGVIGTSTVTTASSARAEVPGPATVAVNYAVVGLGGDVDIDGGGTSSPSGNVGGAVYADGTFGANNGPHAVVLPATLTNYDGTACSPSTTNHVDVGGTSNSGSYTLGGVSSAHLNTSVSAPSGLAGLAPTTTGPTYAANSASAYDSSGNWQPGTYDGWYPSGTVSKNSSSHTLLDPGVYVIRNVTSGIALSDLSNAISTAQGTADTTGAVVFVLDSSDNGSSLSFSNVTLNGLDDLSGGTQSPSDPEGTHNFVIYASGFTGDTDFGGATLSGIMYLPNSSSGSHGNSSWTLTGSVWINAFTLKGGGNGTQLFQWVCGLGAIESNGGSGGLIR